MSIAQNTHAGRIVRLSAENVKKLSAVEITPHGDLIVIGGDNGAGKSSLLDSIQMALGGKDEIPGQPVRKGSKKAKVEIDLGDIIVRRTFTEEGGTTLVIENRDGARYPSPQAMLDKLTGKLAFDPMAFLRLEPKKQLEALRKLTGVDLTDLDTERAKLYSERTVVNREVERLAVQAETMPFYPDVPEFPVSVSETAKELEAARAKNRENAAYRAKKADAETSFAALLGLEKQMLSNIESIKQQLLNAEKAYRAHQDRIDQSKMALDAIKETAAALVDIDTAPILHKLAEAEVTNKRINANIMRADAMEVVAKTRAEAKNLTSQIESIDSTKAEMLSKAPFPIDGLGFDTDGVTFGGLPLSQASQAEQIRVAVAIGAALNTKLRVLLVRDGSLLDKKSLALLGDLAREKGLQVWIESVGDGEHVQILIEDGAVKEVRQPEETAATA